MTPPTVFLSGVSIFYEAGAYRLLTCPQEAQGTATMTPAGRGAAFYNAHTIRLAQGPLRLAVHSRLSSWGREGT